MDKKVGVTPLEIGQETIYPTTYDPAKQNQYGTVTLKHEGCEDYTQYIGYRELMKDIDISLVCGEANEKLTAEPSVSDSDSSSNHPDAERQPMQKKAVKQRLIELDQLKQEGLISPEEYRTIRQRILNSI
ncbi:MAG: SHOCT domain-containing protein [Candidatus Thiodiazotropha sp.]